MKKIFYILGLITLLISSNVYADNHPRWLFHLNGNYTERQNLVVSNQVLNDAYNLLFNKYDDYTAPTVTKSLVTNTTSYTADATSETAVFNMAFLYMLSHGTSLQTTETEAMGDTVVAYTQRFILGQPRLKNRFIQNDAIENLEGIIYDWCYGKLNEAQRDTLRCHAISIGNATSNGGSHLGKFQLSTTYTDGTPHMTNEGTVGAYWGLTLITGDDTSYRDLTGSTFSDAVVADTLTSWLTDRWQGFYEPCYNELGEKGFWDGYAGQKMIHLLDFYDYWTQETDRYDFNENVNRVKYMADFWLNRLTNNGVYQRIWSKYNQAGSSPYLYTAWLGNYQNDGHAQWFLNQMMSQNGYQRFGIRRSSTALLMTDHTHFFAWYNPSVPETTMVNLTGTDLDYYDPNAGCFFTRTKWGAETAQVTTAPTDKAVYLRFGTGPTSQQAVNPLHWDVLRSIYGLVIQGGKRGDGEADNALNFYGYLHDAVAKNSILIYDPDSVSTPSPSYNPLSNGRPSGMIPGCNGIRDSTLVVPNFGNAIDNFDDGTYYTNITDCDNSLTNVGIIKALDQNDKFVVLEADATPAYSTRASSVKRRWYYIRPESGQETTAWVIVNDKIVLNTTTNDTTKILYHFVNRPVLDGNYITRRGNYSTGGIFDYTGTTQFYADNGGGRVYFNLLNLTGGSGAFVRLIGGKNSQNKGWQHHIEPADDAPNGICVGDHNSSGYQDTYNNSGDISFEFFVGSVKNGDNPCPGIYPAFSAGISQYNDRNGVPGDWATYMDIAGDWRVEIIFPPTGTGVETMEATYAVHVTSDTAPMVTPTYTSLSGNVKKVTFNKEGYGNYRLLMCPIGTNCSSINILNQ